MNLFLAGAGAFVLQATMFAQSDILYDSIARRWLERNEETNAKDWGRLLERRFAHLELGLFDVYLPASALGDKPSLRDLGAALHALLEAQRGWQAWVAGTEPDPRRDEGLARWLLGLGNKPLDAKSAAGAELLALCPAEDSVRTALADLGAELRAGPALGAAHALEGVRIVLFPRRAEFVEFTCVTGALDPTLEPVAWVEGVTSWMEFQACGTRLVALQYAAGDARGDYQKGIAVGERNPAALGELVAQVATRALIERVFAGGVDPAFSAGIANVLVIDLYAELDTRIDGDVRARSSQGSSTFVPGGNPNGGCLPATSAENRWRGTKGKDHFVGILAQVQKQSGKKAGARAAKLGSFELVSDSGDRRELVHAPFLGEAGAPPGAAVFPDYLELVRCYGVAFLHWLRLEGAGKPRESAARFGALLRALGSATKKEDLPRLIEETYHQPLSAPGLDALFESPTLEGRFLSWLAKQG